MANRVEPKLTDADNLEAVERALTQFPSPDKSFAPVEHRGIHELFAEAERNHAAQGALLKMIKARLEHFNKLQSEFYSGQS